ncbi:iron(III) ABC transporter [Pseudomonas sp. IC_126]|uniref:ChaN family lipoprotein n=1 Tax=Pseudomonas sp. IC_126 TaxID=2547400 RepID=UPI00104041DB|nr:ChaN family lipoprotein [Pseudomonas sp. IC_126]TCD23094.1 iron(III) ABC transporter [Pseudomonas sp. IC_126]
MRFLLSIAMILLTACQSIPPLPSWQSPEGLAHPDLGQIIDLRSGERLSAQQLVRELADVDQVLIGERHDNPDHHALQRWFLQALAQRREQGSLLLEMLNPDQQKRVARVQASIGRGQWPADLPGALDWQKGWDWDLYAPVVEYALAQPYPMLAANLDRAEITDIYRRKPQLTGVAAAEPVQKELLAQIRVSHCNMLPEAQLPAMLAVQQQRDRRMADQLNAAPKPAVLLAGAFHVRRDLGAPLHLVNRDTKVLMLAEVGEALSAEQADIVWFTPAQPQQDHCAEFGTKLQ